MNNVSYEAYRSDPDFRQQVERQAREERRKEVNRLIVEPLARWIKHAFAGSRPASAPTRRSFRSFQI